MQKQISKIEAEIVGGRAERKAAATICKRRLKRKSENQGTSAAGCRTGRSGKANAKLFATSFREAKAAERQIESYENKLKNLRGRLGDINQKIKDTEAVGANVTENLADLEKRDSEMTNDIATPPRRF